MSISDSNLEQKINSVRLMRQRCAEVSARAGDADINYNHSGFNLSLTVKIPGIGDADKSGFSDCNKCDIQAVAKKAMNLTMDDHNKFIALVFKEKVAEVIGVLELECKEEVAQHQEAMKNIND